MAKGAGSLVTNRDDDKRPARHRLTQRPEACIGLRSITALKVAWAEVLQPKPVFDFRPWRISPEQIERTASLPPVLPRYAAVSKTHSCP